MVRGHPHKGMYWFTRNQGYGRGVPPFLTTGFELVAGVTLYITDEASLRDMLGAVRDMLGAAWLTKALRFFTSQNNKKKQAYERKGTGRHSRE